MADENLNTSMTVTIEDKNYNIILCDQHAEESTMASIKTRIIKIKEQLDKVIGIAMETGIISGPPSELQTRNYPATTEPTPETNNENKPVKVQKKFETASGAIDVEEEILETQLIEGVGQIPSKIKGQYGETDIHIARTSDAQLQKHFKQTAHIESINNVYDSLRKCTACGSTGKSPVNGKLCMKCKGSGYL